ncbi:hypothetical protein [Desulfocastanea catecholica]
MVPARQTQPEQASRPIGWNGVQLYIPCNWEVRVSGPRHLVFEKDFQPQLQIRWEKPGQSKLPALQQRASHFASRMGSIIAEDDFPPAWRQVRDIYRLATFYQGESGMLEGGIFLGPDDHTLVLFQLFLPAPAAGTAVYDGAIAEIRECLTTITCRNAPETLWRMQDFSLILPVSYTLQDYTFAAGLTRMSFTKGDLFMQTCKLGPADNRLAQQSLKEILLILADTAELETVTGEDNTSCEGCRSPTIGRQVLLRLRREKSFIRAKIWHEVAGNRLLAVILSSNRPIPLTTIQDICRHYEIIP